MKIEERNLEVFHLKFAVKLLEGVEKFCKILTKAGVQEGCFYKEVINGSLLPFETFIVSSECFHEVVSNGSLSQGMAMMERKTG